MAVMGADDEAEAAKWTGEAEVDPGAGELMVTPANADAANISIAITYRIALCTKTPSFAGTKVLGLMRRNGKGSSTLVV